MCGTKPTHSLGPLPSHCLACAKPQAIIPFYLKIGIIFGKASPGLLTGVWSDTKLLHTVPAMVSLPQAKKPFRG